MEADSAAGTAAARQSGASNERSASGVRGILKPPANEAVPLVPKRRTLWQCFRALAESLGGVAGFGAPGGARWSQQSSQQQRRQQMPEETAAGSPRAGRATPPGTPRGVTFTEYPLKTLTGSAAAPAGGVLAGDAPPVREASAKSPSQHAGGSGGAAQPRPRPLPPRPASRVNHRPLPSMPAKPGSTSGAGPEPQLPPTTPPATPTAGKRSQAAVVSTSTQTAARSAAQAEAAANRKTPSAAVPPLHLPQTSSFNAGCPGSGQGGRPAFGGFPSCCCSGRDDHAGASSVDLRAVAAATDLPAAEVSGGRAGYSYGPLVQPPIPCPDSPRPLPPPLQP